MRRLLLALILTSLAAQASPAGDPVGPEYRIKAALLLNIARFVEWTREPSQDRADALVFGILGDNPFGETLNLTFEARTVRGRPLRVRRFAGLSDLKPCHLLFISPSEKGRWREILSALDTESVLTISDVDGFAERGGVANFLIVHDQVRLKINLALAEKAGLKISSQLLKVATIVDSGHRIGSF